MRGRLLAGRMSVAWLRLCASRRTRPGPDRRPCLPGLGQGRRPRVVALRPSRPPSRRTGRRPRAGPHLLRPRTAPWPGLRLSRVLRCADPRPTRRSGPPRGRRPDGNPHAGRPRGRLLWERQCGSPRPGAGLWPSRRSPGRLLRLCPCGRPGRMGPAALRPRRPVRCWVCGGPRRSCLSRGCPGGRPRPGARHPPGRPVRMAPRQGERQEPHVVLRAPPGGLRPAAGPPLRLQGAGAG